MKSKEFGTVSLSPWSSALHTVEDSRSRSLLQPNKSDLKRDMLAQRSGRNRWKRRARLRRSRGMEEGARQQPQRHLEPDTQVETTGEKPFQTDSALNEKNTIPRGSLKKSLGDSRVTRLTALTHNEAPSL